MKRELILENIENIQHKVDGYNIKGHNENDLILREEISDYIELLLRQFTVISCVCPNEIKTGTVAIHCCNLCGKPDEDWWGKH